MAIFHFLKKDLYIHNSISHTHKCNVSIMKLFKKKELGILVFFFMCLSFMASIDLMLSGNTSIVTPLSSNDDYYEENDSYDQAFEIEMGMINEEEGMYEATLQDADWYVIDLTVGDNLSLLIFSYEEIENWMDLFEVEFYSGDHETPVGVITLGEDILQICLESAPATGSYYVYLNPLSATFFDYTMIVWPLMEDDYEENDDISQAKEIYENFQPDGDYLYALDDDWYKVYLEPEWIMDFYCLYLNYIDFQLEVIGTDGTTPIDIDLHSEPESIQTELTFELSGDLIDTAGFYYIHIEPLQGNSLYMIEVNIDGNPLQPPLLYPISPNPNDNGYIFLNWNHNNDVSFYSIYREFSEITSVGSLTPYMENVLSSDFNDVVSENVTYYYAVTSNSGGESSSPSNCESVEVVILPFPERKPILDPISWNYDDYGEVRLRWGTMYDADYYLVYRDDIEIVDVSTLEHIASVNANGVQSSYYWYDNVEENGTYYYAIVGVKGALNSSVSNSESVSVAIIPFTKRSVGYFNIYSSSYTEDGYVEMGWSSVLDAESYYIYRDTAEIADVGGLVPISIQSSTWYQEILTENGTFYYCVVPYNGSDFGELSACRSVEVNLIPFTERVPLLHTIYWHETYYEKVNLNWDSFLSASQYYIYRDTSPITDISSMVPIDTSDYSSFTDYVPESGTYYYVILAWNGAEFSQMSNCESVTVNIIPFNERVPYLGCYYDSSSGGVNLDWNPISDTAIYYIYRLDFQPDGIDGLSPIAMTSNTQYQETLSVNGTFYYVIVGYNGIQFSAVSNCETVVTNILPFSELRLDHLNLYYYEEINAVHLEWQHLSGAKVYYIYRETTPINFIEGLDPIGFEIYDGGYDWISYRDYTIEEGGYYYSVAGFDGIQFSLPSYSQYVNTVQIIQDFALIKPNLYLWGDNSKGMVELEISNVIGAESIYIYRDSSPISTISGLDPIATIDVSNDYWTYYYDIVPDNGNYNYVVMANNGTVNSTISNNREISIDGIQDVNTPEITGYSVSSGKVTIDWNYQDSAAEYLIYREMNNITDIGGLTPYATTQNSYYFYDYSISTNDSYYYVVVARNGLYTSEMSNCLNITVVMYTVAETPVITDISQHSADEIYLNWNYVSDASTYYVYRELTEITDITGLEPVSIIYDSTGYSDNDISAADNYYYVVVAGNGAGNSSISNCMNFTIEFVPPDVPTLNPIVPAIDNDGEIYLEWDYNPLAEGYYIYRCDSEIFDASKLYPIGETGGSSYIDWVSDSQDYHYAIVAYNQFGISDMSNVQSVESNRPAIPDYALVSSSYEWIDTSINPILNQGQEPYYEEIDLSFAFEFYGISFSSVYVSQNGYLSFKDSNPTESWGNQFPTSGYDMSYIIAPFMEGFLYGGSLGTVSALNASGSCIISWENMEYNGYEVSFQVILYEDGSIKFQYDNIGYISYEVKVGLNLGDNIHGESYTGLTTQTNDFAFKYVPYMENTIPTMTLPADISYYSNDGQVHTLSWTIIDPDVLSPVYQIIVDGEVAVNGASWLSGVTIDFDVSGWEGGPHTVIIFVEDGYGGLILDQVSIFVEEIPEILSPGDLEFQEGTSQPQILTWEILDDTLSNPTYNISVDGVLMVENEPWPGDNSISYDVSSFSAGNYVVELVVDDGKGNTDIDTVVVSVNSAPIITTPEDIAYYEGTSDSNIIIWTITDVSVNNPTYTIEVDGEIVVENIPWISDQDIQFDVSGWEMGNYTVKITAIDGNGGVVVDIVLVAVLDDTFKIPGFSIFNIIGLSVITLIIIKKRYKR